MPIHFIQDTSFQRRGEPGIKLGQPDLCQTQQRPWHDTRDAVKGLPSFDTSLTKGFGTSAVVLTRSRLSHMLAAHRQTNSHSGFTR